MKELIVIGAGPGDENYILPAAKKAAEDADIVFGDRRLLTSFSLVPDGERVRAMDRLMDAVRSMAEIDDKKIAVLVSGDPGFYSLLNLLKRTYPEVPLTVIPGISSFSLFASRLGETLADAKLTSAHGREMSPGKLIELIKTNGKVYLLCDGDHDPAWMAGVLCEAGLSEIDMAAGSRLSYPDEWIKTGKARDFVDGTMSGFAVVLIKDDSVSTQETMAPVAWDKDPLSGWLQDAAFIRNKTPMTVEELRWIIMGKLQLKPHEIFWDIGAGTGSVSVEAACHLKEGCVYAFEKNQTALEVLRQNKEKFHCDNLTIIEGEAPEVLSGITAPDAVFIGGAGKKLAEILSSLTAFNKKIRIIIPAVTIETQSEAFMLCASMEKLAEPEMMTVSIGRSRPLGTYHMIEQGHNVALIMTETI